MTDYISLYKDNPQLSGDCHACPLKGAIMGHFRIIARGAKDTPDWYEITAEQAKAIALGIVIGMRLKGAKKPAVDVFEVLPDGEMRIYHTQR